MQEGRILSAKRINNDLLRGVFENPLRYWLIVGFLAIFVLGAMGAAGYMINRGLGVTGLNRPVYWGFFITNFVV